MAAVTTEEAEAALRLLLTPGLGERTLHRLALALGPPTRVLRYLRARPGAPPPGVPAEVAERALGAFAREGADEAVLARALRAARRCGARVLAAGAPGYPAALHPLHTPPYVLFARGRTALLERRTVAIVGSRRMTAHGEDATRSLSAALSSAGVVVVSGLARGIDACAHEEALAGGTIAVLGCGVDVVYPPRNAQLQERIAERGLLLSEFLPGTPPQAHNFPRRNRIIAALAERVVVVEAPLRSGALLTARDALELGKDVLAVPGPYGRPTSAGVNALLRDGAPPAGEPADVLVPMGLAPAAPRPGEEGPPAGLGDAARRLWEALEDEAHVDTLAARAGLPPSAALAGLLELELGGRARPTGGQRFARVQPRG